MSKVIIVGTLAFDSIETPYGNAVNILGVQRFICKSFSID